MGTEMVKFQGDQYLARKKIFKFLGNAFHIYNPSGGLEFYVKQKAFRLKEAIHVFGDEAQTDEVLQIKARSVMDFSGTYDVSTPDGQVIGALRRKGLQSIIRDQWEILDGDTVVGTVEEDSMALAMIRRILNNLVPQSFTVTIGGNQVAVFKQHFNPFVAKYDIDFSLDQNRQLDRRLGIAAVVLLLAIEGRQQ